MPPAPRPPALERWQVKVKARYRRSGAIPEAPVHTRPSALGAFAAHGRAGRWCATGSKRVRLTFELSGRRRQDARPGPVKMYGVPPARAWWPAVGAPLERGVRQHWRHGDDLSVFACRPFCFPLRAWARAVAVLRVCGTCQDFAWRSAPSSADHPTRSPARSACSLLGPRILHSWSL